MQHSENTRDDSQRRCDTYSRPPVIDDLGVMMPFILGTEFCEKKRRNESERALDTVGRSVGIKKGARH